ncbi:MAG: phage portal protein [Flavobacteriaceae bacterium]|nr:phage portal protein [Flavobacteriaceae bacterium]
MWKHKRNQRRWYSRRSMGLFDRFRTTEVVAPSAYVPKEDRALSDILPPARTEITVSTTSALSLIPVSRSIAVLETAIMQIPVEVFRGEEQLESPLWLQTPDIENNVSQAEFIGTTLVHLTLHGNAFWYVTRGARGIANVQVLHPEQVAVNQDNTGKTYYTVNGKKVPNENIKHIKLWHRPQLNALLGEGPIQRHKYIVRQALDLQDYADNWFRRAAVPTGTLTTTEFLSADVALQNKQAFIDSQRERSVAVLSSGLTYDPVALDPEKAQFLENQKFITRQISNMFGVPSVYLGLSVEGAGMTYTNGNEDRNKLYEDGLQQYIVRIEQALSDLLPRGQYAKFNLTEFLRPNQLVRFQSYAIALDKKFMTPNEVRELEGMMAIEGGDEVAATPAPTPNQEQPAQQDEPEPTRSKKRSKK